MSLQPSLSTLHFCRACSHQYPIPVQPILLPRRLRQLLQYSYRLSSVLSYFCPCCGSLSHFPQEPISYADGSYRTQGSSSHPPVSLPWSTITYQRHHHIQRLLKIAINKLSLTAPVSMLDYGGYNGFGTFGLCQEFSISFSSATVADLDPSGLAIAAALGFNTINLAYDNSCRQSPAFSKPYSLITAVHVLEHMPDPNAFFESIISCVDSDTLLYIEVPSRFFFPLSDASHLSTFSRCGLEALFQRHGYEVVLSTCVSTPRAALSFDYDSCSPFEAYACIFRLRKSLTSTQILLSACSTPYVHFLLRSSLADVALALVVVLNRLSKLLFSLRKFLTSLLLLAIGILFSLFTAASLPLTRISRPD